MKPILKDNICRGSIKQELFFETSFFGIFIKRQFIIYRHLLNVTPPLDSITHFNYLTFFLVSCFTSFKTVSHPTSKLSIINVYIQQCIPMEG
jgi:hypothetical protein